MARICGIDLDKNEARFVVLDGFDLVKTEVTRLGLVEPKDQDEVRAFQIAVQAFFDETDIVAVGIRERLAKGRMKGGTITFKLEGLVQMCRQNVVLISPATIRKAISEANIDLVELPISKYQHEAYGAALYLAAGELVKFERE